MMIALFYIIIITVTSLLTFLTGLSYWFIPLWLVIGIISSALFVTLSLGFLYPFAAKSKVTNRFKHYYVREMSRLVLHVLFRVRITEVINKEYIPKDTNYVVFPNHKTSYDAFIISSVFKRPMGYAAKDSLYNTPIFGGWLRHVGSLKINRENDRETLKEIVKGIKYIEKGLCMTVFPEGTRTSKEISKMMPGRPGSYRIATKANVPIIPVALVGNSNVGKTKKIGVDIKVVIGKPLYPSDYESLTTLEIADYVVDTVNSLITKHEK